MPHGAGRAARGLLWCLALACAPWPAARADILIEPYLQNPQPDGITILWWTDASQPDSRVEFGLTDFSNTAAASDEKVEVMDKYLHQATLSGLALETSYRYRVRSGPHVSGEYAFQTAVAPTSDFHVAMMGDGQVKNPTTTALHRAVLEQAKAQDPHLVFELGDMVHKGTDEYWIPLYRKAVTATDDTDPGSDLGSLVPYHTLIGNHDIYDGSWSGSLDGSMAIYKAFAANPANGSANPDWEERYYTIRYGCATFIILDANNTSDDAHDNHDDLEDGSTPDWEPGSEQHNWMLNALQQAQDDGVFTFVMFHPSPYSRGVHGGPFETTEDHQRGYQLRCLEPVFRQFGVDAVATGHDHMVEHCLTGPAGFESAMDVGDPANLSWLVHGNGGNSARYPASGWETWMDVQGNDGPPYYTVWFYDWPETDERSFLDIDVTYQGGGVWRAHFATIQADGDRYHEFDLFRAEGLPHAPATVAASDGAYSDRVRVEWDAAWGATRYEVWRAETDDPADASPIATVTAATTCDDTSAIPGVTYWYWVVGTNEHGTSAMSPSDYGHCRVLGPVTVHVDDDNDSGVVNGTPTWPFDTIQAAIDAADAGDTVLVHDGTYTGDGNRDLDLLGKAITVQSQNGPDNCIIDCEGTEQDPHRGFYFQNAEGQDSVLRGFTITNAHAPATGAYERVAGAILCVYASPTIEENVLADGYSERDGAGIFCEGGAPRILRNTITRCEALLGSAGIHCYHSDATISGNRIVDNLGNGGVGIFCRLSSPAITDNVVSGNVCRTIGPGGGIQCQNCAAGLIAGNTITANSARYGGGIYCVNADVTIVGNVLTGNRADVYGGAVCLMQSEVGLANNTIAGNRAGSHGGGVFVREGSSTTITDCIMWANEAANGSQLALAVPSDPNNPCDATVHHCDAGGGQAGVHVDNGCTLNWGTGNIDADPLFVDPDQWDGDTWVEGNCHLQDGSPCINAGDNAAVEAGETDMDGEARIQHLVVDMGADETDSIGAPNEPGPASFDKDIFVGRKLNPAGPAANSAQLVGLQTNGNPPETLYAVQVGTAPGAGWLRFVNADGRTDILADGTAPDWAAATEWQGKRVRGLAPDTTHTFYAACRTPPGAQAPLDGPGEAAPAALDVGTVTTSRLGDVDRDGAPAALDLAHVKAAILKGLTSDDTVAWPCDLDGDGDLDSDDLAAAKSAAMAH